MEGVANVFPVPTCVPPELNQVMAQPDDGVAVKFNEPEPPQRAAPVALGAAGSALTVPLVAVE
jgi:hypothetical protein